MAKGFKCGAGGGNLLNFKVVGNPQPTSPKKNTIWVNTNQKITSWDFSATQPHRRSGNKNLIVYPYYHSTLTEKGLTFTDNKDGTITVNGTATADTFFRVHFAKTDYVLELEPGTYTISDVAGTKNGRTELLGSYDNQSTWSTFASCNNGEATFTITQKAIVRAAIKLYSGKKYNNVVFKPQLEKGSSATSFVKGDATGQVWGIISISSTVAFNALKKNGIQVYPISAKQYVDGTWVDVTAKSYQGGEWVDWIPNGALYYRGNECVHITGGWRFAYDGSNAGIGTGVKNSDSIKISTSGNQAISATTVKALDLSKVNTATVNVVESINNSEENYYRAAIMLIPEGKPLESTQAVLRYTIPKVISNPLRVDVSGITSGRHFICVYLRYESGSHSLTFDEVMTT